MFTAVLERLPAPPEIPVSKLTRALAIALPLTIVQVPSYRYSTDTVKYTQAAMFVTQPGESDATPKRFAGVPMTRPSPEPEPAPLPAVKSLPAIPPAPEKIEKIRTEEVTVHFGLNSARLSPPAKEILTGRMTDFISADAIHITGYTCPLGSKICNDRLSLNRAKAVKDYLVAHKVSRENMKTVTGLGKRCYVSQKDLAANRRTVVKITLKGGETNDEQAP